MRKLILLTCLAALPAIFSFGQDAPLEQYVGKYIFSNGSQVPWVEVKLVNGALISESPQGNATLQRIEKDQFSIVEYNGMAEFKRNAEGKVTGVKVLVMDLEMEGTKEESSGFKKKMVMPFDRVLRF